MWLRVRNYGSHCIVTQKWLIYPQFLDTTPQQRVLVRWEQPALASSL
jgi:hypothetical protein